MSDQTNPPYNWRKVLSGDLPVSNIRVIWVPAGEDVEFENSQGTYQYCDPSEIESINNQFRFYNKILATSGLHIWVGE